METELLEVTRRLVNGFPSVSERLSHGQPSFFIGGKRCLAMFCWGHHGARPALWFPAAPGVQAMLVTSEPDRFFAPPYFGPSGWVAIYLDVPLDWGEIEALLEASYRRLAPKRLVAELDK